MLWAEVTGPRAEVQLNVQEARDIEPKELGE